VQFDAVLAQAPHDVETLKQAALALGSQHQLLPAEQRARQALALEPRNAGVLRVLGLILEEQNRLEEALQCLTDALAADPALQGCEADRRRVAQRLGS
jgi:Tfp pilus assembly protein PilF